MALDKNKLQQNLANFLEIRENYPRTIIESSEYWAESFRKYLIDGSPEIIFLDQIIDSFRVGLLKLFSSYFKTFGEFANNLSDLIYKLHIDLILSLAPKYKGTPKPTTDKPKLLPIFRSYSNLLSKSLADEIHPLFFRINLIEVATENPVIFL